MLSQEALRDEFSRLAEKYPDLTHVWAIPAAGQTPSASTTGAMLDKIAAGSRLIGMTAGSGPIPDELSLYLESEGERCILPFLDAIDVFHSMVQIAVPMASLQRMPARHSRGPDRDVKAQGLQYPSGAVIITESDRLRIEPWLEHLHAICPVERFTVRCQGDPQSPEIEYTTSRLVSGVFQSSAMALSGNGSPIDDGAGVKWSKPMSLKDIGNKFRKHPSTIKRWILKGKIRTRAISDRSYYVDVSCLPHA